MSSTIPGYEYDIFISYRQKDNKGDRWVSEFVAALKTELESTFKEEISVYFDINPHDGLLETHDVDASLKEKLNCFIFIPIISRTYCDPKSFAWEHEFKAFVEQASQDQFGLRVKLPNGNIASRVLPVIIHDLKASDIKLYETVVGGVLRGVEFIYAEPGVNRPLNPDDDDKINLNRTRYRNQINKVGNAIDEIISGLQTESAETGEEKIQQDELSGNIQKGVKIDMQKKPVRSPNKKVITGSIAALILLAIASILANPKILKQDTLEKLRSSGERISVVVMPFQNMTNDTLLNVWQEGIQNELINNLTNSEELKVRQMQTINGLIQSQGLINYASINPSNARKISQKLNADIFIYGSLKEAGSIVRINAQLVDSKTEEVFKSIQIDEPPEKMLYAIDSISALVRNSLLISKLAKELTRRSSFEYSSTNSPEAYIYSINGQNAFDEDDYPTAIKMFSKALEIDSNFIGAATVLSYSYFNQNLFEEGKEVCLQYYRKRDNMPFQLKILMNFVYSIYFETPYESIACLRQIQSIDDQMPSNYYNIGTYYVEIHQFDKAIPEFEKGLKLYSKWRSKPSWSYEYVLLAEAYHQTGQYRKERKLYKKAQKDFPDSPFLIYNQAILELTKGNTSAANEFIEKYKLIRKDNSVPDAKITAELASLYSEAGFLDKAEEYYRKAESMQSNDLEELNYIQIINPQRMNNLVWFLIDKDRNIDEGLELADKVLKGDPANYLYLDCKGWGLYKQGKYAEALDLLEKAWQLKPIYNHDIYLHLEAAKKAVAGQKIN